MQAGSLRRLHVFAAQCVRRIIARGLLVFLLLPEGKKKRGESEKQKAFSEQSWKNFPTEKSFRHRAEQQKKKIFLEKIAFLFRAILWQVIDPRTKSEW